MPTPPLFKYFLQDDTGKYYYVDGTNTVQVTATKTALSPSAKNWKDTEISFKRSLDYFGLFRSYSIPMGYVTTIAKILRYIFYNGNYDAYCLFTSEKRHMTGDYLYDVYYQGEIDFSQIIDERDLATVNILESGLPAALKANESMPVKIPVTGSDVVTIAHDGIKLKNSATFLISTPADPSIALAARRVPSMIISYTESQTNNDVQSLPDGVNTTSGVPSLMSQRGWFYQSSTDGSVTIDYDFSVIAYAVSGVNYATSSFQCRIQHRDSAGTFIADHILINEPNFGTYLNSLYVLQGTHTFNNVVATDVVFIEVYLSGATVSIDVQFNTSPAVEGTLKIKYASRFPATDIQGFRYIKYVEKGIKLALGSQYGVTSSFLSNPATSVYDNRPYNTIVTSGPAVRQLAGASIPFTFQKMRKDLFRWGLGIGFSGSNVVIEPFSYFLNNSNVLATIDSIKNLRIQSANEYIGNKVTVGYPDETYDEINGRDDYNCEVVFKLPTTRVVNEFKWSSEFSASIYAIEFARSLYFQRETTDSQYDDKVFLIEVDPTPLGSGKYKVSRPAFSVITNVLYPETAYNLGLSPKRQLYRMAPWLKSLLKGPAQNTIKFQDSTKNSKVTSLLGAINFMEDSDEPLTGFFGLGVDKLFLPLIMEFDCVIPDNLLNTLNSNPNGRINFYDEYGNLFGGFPLEITVNDAMRNKFTVKLLSCPDNDVTKLIR